MLITKQYVVFGLDGDEIYRQMCNIKNEFSCAGWEVKESNSQTFLTALTITKGNVRIYVYPHLIGYSRVIQWDNCWISERISSEEINSIIMPLSISDTPEIHFF